MPFSAIRGQEAAIKVLTSHISQGRVPGAYVFSGPDGVGKFMAARQLAKALNCLTGGLDACDQCASCRKIEAGGHPDVHIIDSGDDEVKIETIRQLQKDISLRAYEGRKKCFIIRNAHRLNAESSNALLKTLEEPGKDSCILLVTQKPALLFKTVLSRCQCVKFRALERAGLEELLKAEYGAEAPLAHFLAYYCEGKLGMALALKGAGIMEEKNAVIDEFIISAGKNSRSAQSPEKAELRRNISFLTSWFRDLYLIKLGSAYRELINLDRKDDLLRFVNRFTFAELDEVFRVITELLFHLERNINPKLLIAHLKLAFAR